MIGADRTGARIRQAKGLMRELLDLAEEQGWSLRIKDEGFVFHPPKERARPGFEQLYARDPGTCAKTARVIRDRFKKAGMKFPEDHPERKPKVIQNTPKLAVVQSEADPFTLIKQKINAAVGALSEIESLVAKIQTDNEKIKQLRDALKSLGGI